MNGNQLLTTINPPNGSNGTPDETDAYLYKFYKEVVGSVPSQERIKKIKEATKDNWSGLRKVLEEKYADKLADKGFEWGGVFAETEDIKTPTTESVEEVKKPKVEEVDFQMPEGDFVEKTKGLYDNFDISEASVGTDAVKVKHIETGEENVFNLDTDWNKTLYQNNIDSDYNKFLDFVSKDRSSLKNPVAKNIYDRTNLVADKVEVEDFPGHVSEELVYDGVQIGTGDDTEQRGMVSEFFNPTQSRGASTKETENILNSIENAGVQTLIDLSKVFPNLETVGGLESKFSDFNEEEQEQVKKYVFQKAKEDSGLNFTWDTFNKLWDPQQKFFNGIEIQAESVANSKLNELKKEYLSSDEVSEEYANNFEKTTLANASRQEQLLFKYTNELDATRKQLAQLEEQEGSTSKNLSRKIALTNLEKKLTEGLKKLGGGVWDNPGWINKRENIDPELKDKLVKIQNENSNIASILENYSQESDAFDKLSTQDIAKHVYRDELQSLEYIDQLGEDNSITVSLDDLSISKPGEDGMLGDFVALAQTGGEAKDLIRLAKMMGHENSFEAAQKGITIPYKTLYDLGVRTTGYSGFIDNLINNKLDKEVSRKYRMWEEEKLETTAAVNGLFNTVKLGMDPAKIEKSTSDLFGLTKTGVNTMGREAAEATMVQWLDFSPDEVKDILGEDYRDKLDMLQLGVAYVNKSKDVKEGKVAPITLTKAQEEAFEVGLGEMTYKATGGFVPTLLEFAAFEVVTGGAGTPAAIAKMSSRLKKGAATFAYGAGREEIKMQATTADFELGTGALFYGFGTLFKPLRFFSKNKQGLNALSDMYIKAGPAGALSIEGSELIHGLSDDLMGDRDFQNFIKETYGDTDETFKRIVSNALMFKLTGATHVKATKNAFNRAKYDVMSVDAKRRALQRISNAQQEQINEAAQLLDSRKRTEVDLDLMYSTDQRVQNQVLLEGIIKLSKEDSPNGKKAKAIVEKLNASEELARTLTQQISVESQLGALEPFKRDRNGNYEYETVVVDGKEVKQKKIDPNFEKNFNENVMTPINKALEINTQRSDGGSSYKKPEVVFGRGKTFREENNFEVDKNGRDIGNTAEFHESKDGSSDRILIDLDKYTPGKPLHELTHLVFRTYFRNNKNAPTILKKQFQEAFNAVLTEEGVGFEGSDLMKEISDKYEKSPEDVKAEEYVAYLVEFLGNPEVYYANRNVAGTLAKRVSNQIRLIKKRYGVGDHSIRTAEDLVKSLTDMGQELKKGYLSDVSAKQFAGLADINLFDLKLETESPKKETEPSDKTFASKELTDIAKDYKKDPNKADVLELTDQYNRLALSALGYDVRKGDIPSSEALSFVGKEFPSIMRRFDPTRDVDFSTWVTSNIRPKRQEFYEEQIGDKGKETSIDSEKARQYAGGETPQEVLEKKESKKQTKTLKQVDPLDFSSVKGKEKDLENIIKILPEEIVGLSVGGMKGVSEKFVGEVGSKLYDIPADKITDAKKNLTYAKKINKEGIPEPSEAGNIQKDFANASEIEKFLKMFNENVSQQEIPIGKQGEKVTVSRDVQGRSIGLSNKVQKYLMEPTGKRSKGSTSQTAIWKLKPEFKNPTPETIKKIQEDLGITPSGKLNIYNRDIGQLLKGFAKAKSAFVTNKLVRNKIEDMDLKTAKPKKQILADIKAGTSKTMASKSLQVGFKEATGKDISLKEIEKAEKIFSVGSEKERERLRKQQPELNQFLEERLIEVKGETQPKQRSTNYTSTTKSLGLEPTYAERVAERAGQKPTVIGEILDRVFNQPALEYTENKVKKWHKGRLKDFQKSQQDFIENFMPKEILEGLTLTQFEQLVGHSERVSAKGNKEGLGISNKKRDQIFAKTKSLKDNENLSQRTKDLIESVDWKKIRAQNINAVFNTYNKLLTSGKLTDRQAKFEALKKLKKGDRRNYERAQEALTAIKQDYVDRYVKNKEGKDAKENLKKIEEAFNFIYNLHRGNTNMVRGMRGNVWTEWFHVTEGSQAMSKENPIYDREYKKSRDKVSDRNTWDKLVKGWEAKGQKVKTREEYAAQVARNEAKQKGEHLQPSAGESARETLALFEGTTAKTRIEKELLDNTQLQAEAGILKLVDQAFGPTATYGTNRLALKKLIPILKETYNWDYIEGKPGGKTLYDHLIDVAKDDLLSMPGGREMFKTKQLLDQPALKGAVEGYALNPTPTTKLILENQVKNISEYKKVYESSVRLANKYKMASKDLSNLDIVNKMGVRDKALALGRKYDKPVKKARVFDFDDTIAITGSGVKYTSPNVSGKPQSSRKAILLVGSAGAGKSTIVDKLGLRKQGYKYVNQDVALDWLARNAGLPKDMSKFTDAQTSKWRDLQSKAAQTAKTKSTRLQDKGSGVVIDATGSSSVGFEKTARELADAGYDAHIVFVDSSLDTALKRNKARGERKLTDTTIKNSYEAVQKNKKEFSEYTDRMVMGKPLAKEFTEINTDNLKQGDPLPAEFISKINDFTSGYVKGRLTAEEFAKRGTELLEQGAEFDFSEFNKVVDGKKGPLFDLMKKMKEAAGDRDMFILTARSQEAAPAIHKFLKDMGIDIPLENIKGLGNSSGQAKADWIVEKASEGFNDFYFADDAVQNVEAVKNVLDQLDVKSKVQQARIKASKNLSRDFNLILQDSKKVDWYKSFSAAKGKIKGAEARKQKFFIPPSAEDFLGLLYPTLGKGKKGERHLKFYKDNLFKPYSKAMSNLSTDRSNLFSNFKALKKQLDVPKDLRKKNESGFTNEQAVRVWLFDKAGHEVPGISKSDFGKIIKSINKDPKLQAFGEQMLTLTKGDGYATPRTTWLKGTITTDLIDLLSTTKRKKYLEEWQENIDLIFSEGNLNKLEAIFGEKYRESLENSLFRMKSGKNRVSSSNRLSNLALDYINGSVGTIMFLNMRSALLQGISSANFINWSFNNPLKAGKALVDLPQYSKDFVKIMNSDYLVDRRNGLKLNINENEIANAAKTSKNKAGAIINYLLEKGYTPTKFMDSFAIASGGATFYRNRLIDLKKKGFSDKEAEFKAFEEMVELSEETQQSSDPSRISMQQSSDLGRVMLQFVNTPMQYARLQKRAFQDLAKGRGDAKQHISRIIYYGFIQNLIFNATQNAVFSLWGESTDEIINDEKTFRSVNGMLDSQLRGLGMAGVTVQVLKNIGIDIYDRTQRKRPEFKKVWEKALDFSPAIKNKVKKLMNVGWNFDSKERRNQMFEEGFSLDNPAIEAGANLVSATTNIPVDRLIKKLDNLKEMTRQETETWEAIALFFGWPKWQLEDDEEEEKDKKKSSKKSKSSKKKDNIQNFMKYK
mgnify:CR=1 FL=1|tara:strand:+ start:570 stop:10487 length:9918 start_codon:yes stop_codon:yes gene_type:complete